MTAAGSAGSSPQTGYSSSPLRAPDSRPSSASLSFLIYKETLVPQIVKNLPANVGDLGLIPGLGGSPGEGKGYPFQNYGLDNSMHCRVHGITKNQT